MKAHDVQDPRRKVNEKQNRPAGKASLFRSEPWKAWLRHNGNTACCFGVRFKV